MQHSREQWKRDQFLLHYGTDPRAMREGVQTFSLEADFASVELRIAAVYGASEQTIGKLICKAPNYQSIPKSLTGRLFKPTPEIQEFPEAKKARVSALLTVLMRRHEQLNPPRKPEPYYCMP